MSKPAQTLYSRREAIAFVSAMLGGNTVFSLSDALAADMQADDASVNTVERALLDEMAETLLPETSTPGAKAAGVGAFIAAMVPALYTEADQAIFRDGMDEFRDRCQDACGGTFLEASPEERLALIEDFDREQYEYSRAPDRNHDRPPHFFRIFKELALLGYFTSEIGYTQAMQYMETPGRYDPCAPFEPGDRAWARHA